MQTTCGVLITDGKDILICHPTNGKSWDIPKGKIDPNETERDCAVRELFEETGIVCSNPDELIDLGLHDYKPSKRLHLFKWNIKKMPDPVLLTCVSTFDWNGREIPEMDAFKIVHLDKVFEMVNKDLARVLATVLKSSGNG